MAAGSLQSKKQEPPGKTGKGLGRRGHLYEDLRESHVDRRGENTQINTFLNSDLNPVGESEFHRPMKNLKSC